MDRTNALLTLALLAVGGGIAYYVWIQPQPGGANGESGWQSHTQGLPFVVGYAPGMEAARKTPQPVLLFATTTWCGWCKRMASESFNDPEVRKKLSGFTLVLVDGDAEGQALGALGVTGYPTLIFLMPDGQELGRIPGYKPKAEFSRILDHVQTDYRREVGDGKPATPVAAPSAAAHGAALGQTVANLAGEATALAVNAPPLPEAWNAHVQGLPFYFGFESGLNAARAAGRPLLVFFTASSCGWCKKLAAENFTQPEIRQALARYVCVLVDREQEPHILARYGGSAVPHLAFCTSDGRAVAQATGYRPRREFLRLLQTAEARLRP